MVHGDGYRGDRYEGTGVVPAGLDPVSTGYREADVISRPLQGFQSGLPEKQNDAFIAAHGRHIRSVPSSCTTAAPAVVARHALQFKLRSKRTDDDRRGHPADGVVCTHPASELPGCWAE